ncbi:uncharacterized protein LOC143054022 [Mytilus galloprovincialis]|uniref:Uncharacterized protein n=2 Tax=Mytilus TaxID=6548 RepID=A0A8B6EV03_MYTGA|nr:unnamed protein product [Mytilus edulis]VDI38998.1 Hypothetical predicted protein [Mytilus galloprovincialis]
MACAGCCCDSTPISWVSYIVTWVALICGLVAIFTPYWNEQDNNPDVDFAGLFSQCKDDISNCFSISNVLNAYKGTDFYDDFLVNLSLQMSGLVALIVAIVLFSIYSCCLSNKYLAYVIIGFQLFAFGAIIAGATVYGVKWMEYYTAATTLSWSFGLDVASGALSLVAAILLIINSCCL